MKDVLSVVYNILQSLKRIINKTGLNRLFVAKSDLNEW